MRSTCDRIVRIRYQFGLSADQLRESIKTAQPKIRIAASSPNSVSAHFMRAVEQAFHSNPQLVIEALIMSKKRRFTYIVTSEPTHSSASLPPVLGVRISLKAAHEYFLSCVKYAASCKGHVLRWSLGRAALYNETDQKRGKVELHKAYVSGDDGSGTTITLERW